MAEKFGFQQIFWYRSTLTDLHAQRPPTFGINHDVTQTPIYGLFDTGDRVFDGSAHRSGRVTGTGSYAEGEQTGWSRFMR